MNTTVSLDGYYNKFVQSQISMGKYKSPYEVVLAALKLLENEETKIIELKNAIKEGMDSPLIEDFDFDENLRALKSEKK